MTTDATSKRSARQATDHIAMHVPAPGQHGNKHDDTSGQHDDKHAGQHDDKHADQHDGQHAAWRDRRYPSPHTSWRRN